MRILEHFCLRRAIDVLEKWAQRKGFVVWELRIHERSRKYFDCYTDGMSPCVMQYVGL
jgi:hypothetical protein